MEEKRKYVRLDASIKVSYRILKGPEVRHEALSRNIGGGGIRFPVEERLKKDSLLELEIDLPNGAGPIEALGQVVWREELLTKGEGKKEHFDVGMKFVRINPSDRERLLKYVYGRIHGLIYDELGKTIEEMKKERET